MGFRERKKERTEYFYKYIYKNKLIVCTACSGTGWYDSLDKYGNNIKCGSCNGTGKKRER